MLPGGFAAGGAEVAAGGAEVFSAALDGALGSALCATLGSAFGSALGSALGSVFGSAMMASLCYRAGRICWLRGAWRCRVHLPRSLQIRIECLRAAERSGRCRLLGSHTRRGLLWGSRRVHVEVGRSLSWRRVSPRPLRLLTAIYGLPRRGL